MKKLLLGSLLLLSGCCTIVDSPNEVVTFNSNVEKANIKIMNKQGMVVYSGQTPTTLTLNKKAGYFSGETYLVRSEKEGYGSEERLLDTRINGWYWANILFGGLIGFLIIDPATGAMWTFRENNVFTNLEK